MKKIFAIAFSVLFQLPVLANDGAFFASGNHLIPIMETDISVRKEILTIKKIRDKYVEVTVYYEFFNPKQEKEILMGFEAFSPSGDVDGTPKNGLHPYMRDFTVNLNNQILRYDVAYVEDKKDYQNGKINSQTLENVKQSSAENENNVPFYYVYHFKAKFKAGLNIIKHTYNYDLSGSVDNHYSFDYILTAANRWANKQIDDFTLIVDMGELETFNINKSFFTSPNDWIINGIGKSSPVKGQYSVEGTEAVKFVIQKGNLIFQKQNFKPAGELVLYSPDYFFYDENTDATQKISFSYYHKYDIPDTPNELTRKILKNLPFARRGYIFTNKEIQDYYNKMDWYIPNPNYKADVETLTEMEKEWIERWK